MTQESPQELKCNLCDFRGTEQELNRHIFFKHVDICEKWREKEND